MRRHQVERLRQGVLHLHKQIIDDTREAVERVEGRLAPHAFLERLMRDEAFAWLRPLSALVVALDQWLDAPLEEPALAADLADELRRLLAPDPAGDPFQQRYAELMQRSPAIILAHAAAIRVLGR